MSSPCHHCGRSADASVTDVGLDVELEELRTYCQRLETVVSNEATATAVLHDLRSVLMALTSLLDRDAPRAGDGGRAARHAAELARQIATGTAPRGSAERHCAPNEVLVRLQHVLEALVPGRLLFDLGADVGAVDMPPLRLQRVVLNLVANAGDAAGDGGTVRIGTARADGVVVLTVNDDGAGIPPEAYEEVRRPTFSTKDSTGLGLALVSRALDDAGGRLDVFARASGGTTVRVELPSTP
jgi:two-component system, OmpR family, sensor kinase